MVAETLSGTRVASTFPVYKPQGSGNLACAYGSYSVAANVEDGDIFELCKLPKGAVVVGGAFWGTVLDSDATETLDLDVGWAANGEEAADPDGFVNGGVLTGDAVTDVFAAGNYRPFHMAAGPLTFTAETTVQVEANAAAATFAAGTIYVVVYYVVP